MRKWMITTAVLAMAASSPAFARGGHGHGHGGHMHRHSRHALSAPANPTVPPSLTSDARLTGSAPLSSRRESKNAETSSPEKLAPEDAVIDRKIKSICRGC
jgi:hypothetical protein